MIMCVELPKILNLWPQNCRKLGKIAVPSVTSQPADIQTFVFYHVTKSSKYKIQLSSF